MGDTEKTETTTVTSSQGAKQGAVETSTDAFARSVLSAVGDRGRDTPSRWHDMDARTAYDKYMSGLFPYRVITIAAVIAVAAVYYMMPSDWPIPWVGQLVIALLILLGLDRAFTARSRKASSELTEVVTQDCDTKKYREILGYLGHRDVLHVANNTLAVEHARCDYLDGKPEAVLNRLDAIKGKHLPRNLRILILNMRANAYASLGRSKECGDTLVELEVLGNGLSNHGHRKSVDDLVENLNIQLKDADKMTGEDAGIILEKLEKEPTHAGRVSLQLTLARYLAANGHQDDAMALLNDDALNPMVHAAEMTRDGLLAELDGTKPTK